MRLPLLFIALAFGAVACSDVTPVRVHPGSLDGLVTLRGADDHSGVRLRASGPAVALTRTNADGEYHFDQLPPGDYVVEASADDTLEGRDATVVQVPDSQAARAQPLVLTPVGRIEGKATLGEATGNIGIVVMAAGTGASAITSDDGHFVLEGVPVGARDLVAVYPGRQTAGVKAIAVTRGQTAQASAMVLAKPQPPSGGVHGLALLDGLSSQAGLFVTATGPSSGGAVTTATGDYTIAGLADGDYTLTLVAPSTLEGSIAVPIDVQGGKVSELVAKHFTPLGNATGSVSLGAGGASDVRVAVPGTNQVALSDETGRWTLRGLGLGKHTLVFSRPGFDAQTRDVTIAWNETATVAPLVLPATRALPGAIAGSVQITGETSPANVLVTLAGPVTRTALTDAQGTYLFAGLPDGAYQLSAEAASTVERLRTQQITVSGAQAQAALARFSPLGKVRGRVLLQGLSAGALGGVRVQVTGTSLAALTADDGTYAIDDVPTGTRDVVAALPGFFTASKTGQKIAWNQTLQVLDIVLGDVNECASGNGGCDPNATCANAPGTRTCRCKTGFTGNGLACMDVDECATNNGGCDAHATCTNVPGSRTCTCGSGWTGTGLACSDVNECASNNGGCGQHASCQNTQGGHTCSCATGYQLSNGVCVDVNECATNNGGCDRNATCANTDGASQCTCNAGFAGDGFSCTPGASYQQASVGGDHACGVQADGTLWCWGSNGNGQLGIGSTVPQSRPTRVGVSSAWHAVATGDAHSCAVHKEGTLWCWGRNDQRQLGDGTNTDRSVPIQIGSATDWTSIAAGSSSTCALKRDGTLWCWRGSGSSALVPTQVGSDGDWAQVALGRDHTCARKLNGTLWCWGAGASGQLGLGTITSADVPQQVGSATDWASVTAGLVHTCARKTGGTLWCWGDDASGQLGVSGGAQTRPVQVGSAADWTALSAGDAHTCATKTTGQLWCWGANQRGQLGDGTLTGHTAPARVGSDTSWSQVFARNDTTCATHADGRLACFGSNSWGQIGNGRAASNAQPTQVDTRTRWAEVHLSDDKLCARQNDNTLWCTAASDGASAPRRLVQQGLQTAWGTFDNSPGGVSALRLDGTLWSWSASAGEALFSSASWEQFSSRFQHACAVQTDGTLWCWGRNSSGQLGDGTLTSSTAPEQVGSDSDWIQVGTSLAAQSAIGASEGTTCAVKASGALFCWGANDVGQLGDGTTVGKSLPVRIGSDAPWAQVSVGARYACGIRQSGSLWCWGDNAAGQLGQGDFTRTSAPVQVGTGSDWLQVVTGSTHTCARKTDRTLWCWGDDAAGQLGNGTTQGAPRPVRVGTASDWTDVSVGGAGQTATSSGFTCGTRADGTLWCWGDNDNGRMGDGSLVVTQPTFVLF